VMCEHFKSLVDVSPFNVLNQPSTFDLLIHSQVYLCCEDNGLDLISTCLGTVDQCLGIILGIIGQGPTVS
jgi:hypothetical protein